jgi:uncharacterized damage-inducible protein DinB
VLLDYLDYFRSVLLDKLNGLSEVEQRSSRLPSGWSPLELLNHLTYVERRWLVWGFLGQPVADPWGDSRDDRWHVEPQQTLADLTQELRNQAAVTRAVAEGHDLSEVGQLSDRWAGAPPATLERILLHLVQEYARHAGHLDIVRELIDGRAGE